VRRAVARQTSHARGQGYIAAMKTFHSYSEVSACVGQEVAVTDWITITQEQVNLFAQATGDHQWIHVDPERAKAGPFGAPIAHGFLTLSLIPRFFEEALTIEGARMGVNYGLNRVRFHLARAGGQPPVRARLTLQATEALAPDGMQMTWLVTVEREGGDKPACVAESLSRSYGAPA
jgi:acyl dehydratase